MTRRSTSRPPWWSSIIARSQAHPGIQAAASIFQGMGPGTEKRTVFFPRTADQSPLRIQSGFCWHEEFASGRITVNVVESTDENDPCYVVYELDFKLTPVNAGLSNGLMERYRQMQESGHLPKEPLAAVAERLKSEIRLI